MLKKLFSVKLNPDTTNERNSEVVQWFSRMNRESIPASIEYAEDGRRKVDVVDLSSDLMSTIEDDVTLVAHLLFERYKMKNSGDGAFYRKSSVEDFNNFKSYFVVEEAR